MLTILAFTSAAFAAEARHEVSLGLGSLDANDPGWNVLGGQTSPFYGLRAGYRLTPWLTIIGSWELSQIKTNHDASYDYDEYYEPHDEVVPSSASASSGQVLSDLSIHHVSLGAKFSHAIKPWLVPYATTQGAMHMGSLRVTDDWDKEEAMINVNASGMAFGGFVSAGIELRSKPISNAFSAALHLELGYSLSTALDFQVENENSSYSSGELSYTGPTISTGVGIRF